METHEARSKLSAYLDGTLDAAERSELEGALAVDSGLRSELQSLKVVDEDLRSAGEPAVPPGYFETFASRVEEKIVKEELVGTPPPEENSGLLDVQALAASQTAVPEPVPSAADLSGVRGRSSVVGMKVDVPIDEHRRSRGGARGAFIGLTLVAASAVAAAYALGFRPLEQVQKLAFLGEGAVREVSPQPLERDQGLVAFRPEAVPATVPAAEPPRPVSPTAAAPLRAAAPAPVPPAVPAASVAAAGQAKQAVQRPEAPKLEKPAPSEPRAGKTVAREPVRQPNARKEAVNPDPGKERTEAAAAAADEEEGEGEPSPKRGRGTGSGEALASGEKATAAQSKDKPEDKSTEIDDLLATAFGGKSSRPKVEEKAKVEDEEEARPERKADERSGSPAGAAPVPERITLSDVKKGMNELEPRVRSCYRRYQIRGVAEVTVVIAPSGKVQTATLGGDFVGTPTGTCVLTQVRTYAAFPTFKGNPMTLTYPFSLR